MSASVSPPPSRRVLFVDDDPQLLSGLGKALRKYRDRWQMVFAESGEAALAELRANAFDVVVSDMRMPVMDGAALLAAVRDHDPTTIRMILSGFSDRNAIVRALPVAHQFFTKPCDLAELRAALDRACELRALFSSEPLRKVIGALGALPPTPTVYHQLATMVGQVEVSTDAVAALVEQDARLRAQVLQIASAPGFGADQPVVSVGEAVQRIGVEMLVGIALASHAFSLAGDRPMPEFPLAERQQHALRVARTAREMVTARDAAGPAFVAGMAHEIGRIAIAAALPAAHAAITAEAAATGAAVVEIERRVLGTSHAEIGAYLLGLWGLPLPAIHAIAHHDDPTAIATPVLTALRNARAKLAAA